MKCIKAKINACITDKISFNQETIIISYSIIENIRKAKVNGFDVSLYYIGLNSVELAKERIQLRMKDGGHGVVDSMIPSRYSQSLNDLKDKILLFDNVYLYDNSNKEFNRILVVENKDIKFLTDSIPGYLKPFLDPFINELKFSQA